MGPVERGKFPCTSPSRRNRGFIELLTAVDLYAPPGFQFRGQFVSPGATFAIADLPRPAVLIERAGRVRIAPQQSRYSWADLILLWRFDFEVSDWIEVVRTTTTGSSWTVDFAPIAARLLHPDSSERPSADERARPLVDELVELINGRLKSADRETRCYVLAGIETHVAAEIVRSVEDLTICRIGAASETLPRLGAHPSALPGEWKPRTGTA